MATTTAPPVTAPQPERASAPTAPTGPLASILAPVQPARPVEPIGSTASMAEESITTVGKPAKQPKQAASKPEHPVGALVRAIAARIGRTGSTHHIKRQHTITESRVSGNSVNTSNANRSNRDAKHHQIGQHQNFRDAKVADNNSKIRQHLGRDQRDVKTSDAKASTQNGASRTGRDIKDHRDAKSTDATTTKQDAIHQTGRDGLEPRPGKTVDGKTTGAKAKDGEPAKASDPAKKPRATKAAPQDHATAGQPPTTIEVPATNAARPRTQSSRDAGYHDGTVAAKVTGHVKAYRDGAKDGYADGTAEYEAEKRRMDTAKARNAIQPDRPPVEPAMQPVSGSTADLAKQAEPNPAATNAEPVQLTGISATSVSFDADGASHTLSRGEVRTLKSFERRMSTKRPVMQKVAEDSKTTRAKAVEHATQARRLAERAKDVKGGGRLIGKLQSLAEKSEALRLKTEQIEKAALRGAEAVTVLVVNANTRHGGIYKAVADSPLTAPAEREFYQDKEGS